MNILSKLFNVTLFKDLEIGTPFMSGGSLYIKASEHVGVHCDSNREVLFQKDCPCVVSAI